MEKQNVVLTAEEEQSLLHPIDEYIGKIQEKINTLRADGTDRIIALNNHIAVVRENANYTKEEKAEMIQLFFRYVDENIGTGYAVKWSEWLTAQGICAGEAAELKDAA